MLQLFAENYQKWGICVSKRVVQGRSGLSGFLHSLPASSGRITGCTGTLSKTLSLKSGCTPHPSAPSQGSSLPFDGPLQHSHGDRMVTGSPCPTHGSQRDTEWVCIKCFTSLTFHNPPKSTSCVTPGLAGTLWEQHSPCSCQREGWTGLQESGMGLGWARGKLWRSC